MKRIKIIVWTLYVIIFVIGTPFFLAGFTDMYEELIVFIVLAVWIGGTIAVYSLLDRIILNPHFKGHKTGIDETNGVIILCSADYPKHTGTVWIVSENDITEIYNEQNGFIPFDAIQHTELNSNTLSLHRDVIIADNGGDWNGWQKERFTKNETIAKIKFTNEDKKVAEAIYARISKQCANTDSFQFQFSFQSQKTSHNDKQI